MTIMTLIPQGADPARRVRLLANRMGECFTAAKNNTLNGVDLTLYQRLSSLQCWNSALLCAWAAKGINSTSITLTASEFGLASNEDHGKIFGPNAVRDKAVRSAAQLLALPQGCFIGFVSSTNIFRHCMLHISEGWGAGNKNDCIFRDGHTVGFEKLDLTKFFFADSNHNGNEYTTMVYAPIKGQTI